MTTQFIYRSLSIDIGNGLIDRCEALGENYDVWNADDLCFGNTETIELGLSEANWRRFTEHPQQKAH